MNTRFLWILHRLTLATPWIGLGILLSYGVMASSPGSPSPDWEQRIAALEKRLEGSTAQVSELAAPPKNDPSPEGALFPPELTGWGPSIALLNAFWLHQPHAETMVQSVLESWMALNPDPAFQTALAADQSAIAQYMATHHTLEVAPEGIWRYLHPLLHVRQREPLPAAGSKPSLVYLTRWVQSERIVPPLMEPLADPLGEPLSESSTSMLRQQHEGHT